MFTKTTNFPLHSLALLSLCTKKLTFRTWNWFLIKKNGRSRPETTSETQNDRIGFCCPLKCICFGRYEQRIPSKGNLTNGFWIYLFSVTKARYLTDNQNLRFHNYNQLIWFSSSSSCAWGSRATEDYVWKAPKY